MNDELIKREALINRIDEWQSKLDLFDYFDSGEAERLLADCRAALSRKYVPMTDDEIEQLPIYWLLEDQSVSVRRVEAEVIRRAGLEVSN